MIEPTKITLTNGLKELELTLFPATRRVVRAAQDRFDSLLALGDKIKAATSDLEVAKLFNDVGDDLVVCLHAIAQRAHPDLTLAELEDFIPAQAHKISELIQAVIKQTFFFVGEDAKADAVEAAAATPEEKKS